MTTWTWVSNFPLDQNIWTPNNIGLDDEATYTGGVGFVSKDAEISTNNFNRILSIEATGFLFTEVNSITMNFDYTLGAFNDGSLSAIAVVAVQSDTTVIRTDIIFDDATSGTDQEMLLEVNEVDIVRVSILLRSSRQGSASFSGAVVLNSLIIVGNKSGGSSNPFTLAGKLLVSTPVTSTIASIDADGSNIYLAAINDNGFPTLVKIATSLLSDGSVVFDPGFGTNIGVKCGRNDAETVWIAGLFDGTNTVEKSEDAGSTFVVKDDGTFGTVEAFVIGPDSDDRVLIADDNVNIEETVDSGAIWTNRNTTTGFNVNAIARLDTNPQEAVFGNDASATDNIDYSINSGVDMEDFTVGDFPTDADVTSVIVN